MKKSSNFKMLALVIASVAFAACGSSSSSTTGGSTTDTGTTSDTASGSDTTATGDGTGGSDAVSCAAYATPTTNPGCTSADDKTFVDALKTDDKKSSGFQDQVRDCTLTHGCMAKGTDCPTEEGKLAIQGQCIADCIVDNLPTTVGKVSKNCAWCYGAYSGACGFNHCLAECATDTPDCAPCLAKNCDPVRDACKDGK